VLEFALLSSPLLVNDLGKMEGGKGGGRGGVNSKEEAEASEEAEQQSKLQHESRGGGSGGGGGSRSMSPSAGADAINRALQYVVSLLMSFTSGGSGRLSCSAALLSVAALPYCLL
jgi:hypothetical protein